MKEEQKKNTERIWVDVPTSAKDRTTSSGMTFRGKYVERKSGESNERNDKR